VGPTLAGIDQPPSIDGILTAAPTVPMAIEVVGRGDLAQIVDLVGAATK
jgi:hypothetical protein